MISSPHHEEHICREGGTEAEENIMDMGYRSVIPAVIGRLLNSKRFGYDKDAGQDKAWDAETQLDGPPANEEDVGQEVDEHTWREVRQAESTELRNRVKRTTNIRATRLGILLVLGNRHIRRMYQEKIDWWVALQQATLGDDETTARTSSNTNTPVEITTHEKKKHREQEYRLRAIEGARNWQQTREG